MSRRWRIVEVIFSILLIGLAVLSVIVATDVIKSRLYFLEESRGVINYYEKWPLILSEILFISLISISYLVSGIFLMLEKRIGWILALCIFIVLLFGVFHNTWEEIVDEYREPNVSRVLTSIPALLVPLFILTRRPFLKKYNPNKKSYLLVIAIISLFVIVRVFLK